MVTATFNGAALTAAAGSTVGAALVTNGIRSWRSTRAHDRPRGLFCGIGVCFDCLVEVDGAPNQRACMVTLRPGMAINGTAPTTCAPGQDGPDTPTAKAGESA
nr:(2Fe-2S)-binding protein [Citricoccus sp. SGAir0253]